MKNSESGLVVVIPSIDQLSKFETKEAFVPFIDEEGKNFEIELAKPDDPDNRKIENLVIGRNIFQKFEFPPSEQLRLEAGVGRFRFELFVDKKK